MSKEQETKIEWRILDPNTSLLTIVLGGLDAWVQNREEGWLATLENNDCNECYVKLTGLPSQEEAQAAIITAAKEFLQGKIKALENL